MEREEQHLIYITFFFLSRLGLGSSPLSTFSFNFLGFYI